MKASFTSFLWVMLLIIMYKLALILDSKSLHVGELFIAGELVCGSLAR